MKDKVVVITGASGVLCSAIAAEYARCGAKVCLISRNEEKLNKITQEIRGSGGIASYYIADVMDKNALIAARDAIEKDYGVCDILVNGAGGNNPKGQTTNEFFSLKDLDNSDIRTFFDLELDGFDQVFKLNLMGVLIVSQVFARGMLLKGKGNILNVSSMSAYKPLTKIPAYSSAKSAVNNITNWLAVHFAANGIRVNAIAPGYFSTIQNKALLYNADGSETDRTKKIIAHTPMGRFGKPSDLFGAVMWLTDDDKASFVTGIIVPIDGGVSAFSGV